MSLKDKSGGWKIKDASDRNHGQTASHPKVLRRNFPKMRRLFSSKRQFPRHGKDNGFSSSSRSSHGVVIKITMSFSFLPNGTVN